MSASASGAGSLSIDDYTADFGEEPGFLDFGLVGPPGRAVAAEEAGLRHTVEHARFGYARVLDEQLPRLQRAVSALTGFRDDQIVYQPSASLGLMHTMFGITGGVALSAGEFPAVAFAAQRASDALGVLTPRWIATDDGRVTPGGLREQLDSSIVAVAVSLVDFRTGYLADLEGIRQVIGDRLLVVDATQALGVVDAPWEVADAVVAAGYKWPRAGWGNGVLALSDRALEHLEPVWSGFPGTDATGLPVDVVPEPTRGAAAYQVSLADPIAAARLAVALERIAAVGVPEISARVLERTARLIELADRHAVPVVSPRADPERAGLVVLRPAPDHLTPLVAALHNAGVTATSRSGSIRLGAHVSTTEETFDMLRAALVAYRATAAI